MFSFWELIVIFVVALLVLGPEELPVAAKTLGRWVGYFRNLALGLRADVEAHMKMPLPPSKPVDKEEATHNDRNSSSL